MQDPLVVRFAHEGGQGGESARGDQFQVAQVSHGDLDRGQFGGARQQVFALFPFDDQVHQFAAVGGDQFCFCHYYSVI